MLSVVAEEEETKTKSDYPWFLFYVMFVWFLRQFFFMFGNLGFLSNVGFE